MFDNFYKKIKPAFVLWIKKSPDSDIWYILLPILIFLAFIFHGFIASSDAASTWFSPFYNATQLLYSWSDYAGLGVAQPNNFTSFFLRLFYALPSLISSSPEFIQKAAWISFFSLTGLLLMYLINSVLRKPLHAFVSVLFLFFNPVSQLFLWQQQQWSFYLIFPYFLGTFLYLKFCNTGKFFYAAIIPVIWLFFGFAFNQPAYFAPFLILLGSIFFFTLARTNKKRLFILENIGLAILFVLVNFVYLLPLFIGGGSVLNSTQSGYGGTTLPILTELKNVNFFYSFINITKGYGLFYTQNILFIGMWTVFFLIVFYSAFSRRDKVFEKNDKHYLLLFVIILLIFIFFTKGISAPFSAFSQFLYSFKIMYIFRGFKEKFAIGYVITLAFLFIYLFRTKSIYMKRFLVMLGIVSYVGFASNFWFPEWLHYSDDLRYLSAVQFPTQNDSRVLNLPLVGYSFFYTKDPDYVGDNPMKNIFKKNVIYSSFLGITDKRSELIKEQTVKNTLSASDFYQYLSEYNIEYILDNKNAYVAQDKYKFAYNYKILNQYPFLTKVSETATFILYRFSDYYPKVYSLNSVFQTISPIQYKVYLSHVKENQSLSLLESFDPGWRIYAVKNPDVGWCRKTAFYPLVNGYECQDNSKSFSLDELSYPFEKSLFTASHTQIYGYANTWTMGYDDIVNTLDKSYYVKNQDGSVDVELVLYYYPQIYFYVGLSVSLLAFCFSIILILFRYLRMKTYAKKY